MKNKGRIENLTNKGAWRNDKKAASKAGKKGVEVQKELKTARENFQFVLGLIAPETMRNKLAGLMPQVPKGITLGQMMYLRTAISGANGDIKATKEILDRMFGQAKQQVEVSGRTFIELKILEVKK